LIRISDEYRDSGLLVTNVGPGSHAAAAGIARGDVLLRGDGAQLDKTETLTRLAGRAHHDGKGRKSLVVEAVRGGQEMTFDVTAGHLGITVSPLLHRSTSGSTHTREAGAADDSSSGEGLHTIVRVPRELAPRVRHLTKVVQRQGNSKQVKKAKALLNTAIATVTAMG